MKTLNNQENRLREDVRISDKLRLPVTITAVIAGLLLLLAIIMHGYQDVKGRIHDEVSDTHMALSYLVSMEASMLEASIDSFAVNKDLISPFLARDREQLLSNTSDLYHTLRQTHNVTHFYFHNLDQTNFLRVHSALKHGDKIDRYTMKNAAANRQVSSGLELGPLGTFTLRVVKPWFHENRVIGYIELGLEIDHLFARLHDLSGIAMAVLVSKKELNREQWSAGNAFMGRKDNWAQFPDEVLISRHGDIKDEIIRASHIPHSDPLFLLQDKGIVESFPLLDAYNRNVGKILLSVDLKDIQKELINMAIVDIVIVFFTMFIVFNILMHLIRKTECQPKGYNP